MKVHNELEFGFPELIYSRALARELSYRNVRFEREVVIAIS